MVKLRSYRIFFTQTRAYFFTFLVLGGLHIICGTFANAGTTQEVVQRSNLVIPKKSVGFLEFGMSEDTVRSKLGNPTLAQIGHGGKTWRYTSKDGTKILVLNFVPGPKEDSSLKLRAIQFNSPTFKLENNLSVIQPIDFYRSNSAWTATRVGKRHRRSYPFSLQGGGLIVYGGGGSNAAVAVASDPNFQYLEPEKIFFQIGPQLTHIEPMIMDVGSGEGKVEISAVVSGAGEDRELNSISIRWPGRAAKEIDISGCDDVNFVVSSGLLGRDATRVSQILMTDDINFDGYADLSLISNIGASGANTSYCYFLYDKREKTFRYSSEFSGIANMARDPKTKTITTDVSLGCVGACWHKRTFKVQNGVLQEPPVLEIEREEREGEMCTFETKDGKTQLTEGNPEKCHR